MVIDMNFIKAKPIFPASRENEMNMFVGFYTKIKKHSDAVLRITGSSVYNIFVNGDFVFNGPARCCHGVFRVDELPIGKYLTESVNIIMVNLASYCCNSFQFLDQPGFLQAEIVIGDEVIAYTGKDGSFGCAVLPFKDQKTLRMSFQRCFSEVYRLDDAYTKYFKDPYSAGYPDSEIAEQNNKKYIPRGLFLPEYETVQIKSTVCEGSFVRVPSKIEYLRQHYPTDIFKCYSIEEVTLDTYAETKYMVTTPLREEVKPFPEELIINDGCFTDCDMGRNKTGLIQFTVTAENDCTLFCIMDELRENGNINCNRIGAGSAVVLIMKKGTYNFISHEPYTFRFIRFACSGAPVKISTPCLRHVGYLKIDCEYPGKDPEERLIFDAAVETFRQNTYDIFMDCPSRERAGWLCDSFFTARNEYSLTGKSEVEKAFLENFVLESSFEYIPGGMLPMCFPAEHNDHVFIPNWAMWYVIELKEYLKRSGDRELVDRSEALVSNLINYFRKLQNPETRLLEKLESWVFVEWSEANNLTQDINYPSNMLFAMMLKSAGELYKKPDLISEADAILDHIRQNAMYGDFFCDNAYIRDGKAVLSGKCTETCQYYAFFTGTATPESHPKLWKMLTDEFGPERVKNGIHPDIFPANAFIGNYLRLELLFRNGLREQAMREMKGYYLYMAEKTGTLWELISPNASCCHGFASYVSSWILEYYNK